MASCRAEGEDGDHGTMLSIDKSGSVSISEQVTALFFVCRPRKCTLYSTSCYADSKILFRLTVP
jgi:hypothetical protein